MIVILNGKPTEINKEILTLEEIIKLTVKNEIKIAVAINETHIPKHLYSNQLIHDGDRVEILTPIYGG